VSVARFPRQAWRLVAAGLLAAWLAGCSLVGIAYDNADRWLLGQADAYLALRDDQRQSLRIALRQRLAEHRARELPSFVAFLDRVQRAAADGLDHAEVDGLATELQGLVRATAAGTLPALAAVLASLDDGQVEHLRQRLEEDDERFRKGSVVPAAERRAGRRAKTAVRSLEHWTGDLRADQRARVAELTRAWPDAAAQWYDYRTARTAGLVELLRARPDAGAVQAYLAARWVAHDWRNPGLGESASALRRGVVDLIVAVDGSLSAGQRAAFLERVRGYRDDLADLLPAPRPAVAGVEVPSSVGATP
jgi:hypothetical protein